VLRRPRVAGILFLVAVAAAAPPLRAAPAPAGLEAWGFLVGEWDLVERRYGFDGGLIQTNTGHASFTLAMNDERIQELQTLQQGDETARAMHVFVFDPRSEELEIARTDSGHYGFWVIAGKLGNGRIEMHEKHPDPASDITRRITYRRLDDDRFERQLEFSTDKGGSWFVRSVWQYTRG